MKMLSKFFNGEVHDHVHQREVDQVCLQPRVLEKLDNLVTVASLQGVDLAVLSSYRSFEKQKHIWNEKAVGKRALLDDKGNQLEFKTLGSQEVLEAILRWSAIPGVSRHHWGTEMDVFDRRPLEENPDYKIKLTPAEYKPGGIFQNLGNFLKSPIVLESGFYRPYESDLGGVAPEPWHLSSAVEALEQEKLLSLRAFEEWLECDQAQDLLLIDLIQEQAQEIFKRYITNTYSNPMA
jgi:LAS superfamily LD-carboxypeptidase LdcB